jgi:hypothetical protein
MRDKRFRVTSLALMLLVFGLATSALAVVTTYTWSSVLADSWSTSLAWTPAGPPGAADTVVFDATSDAACVINGGAVTCGVLWLNSGAGTVTIKAGGSLTCDKFTQSAGTFVDNGGTLTSHGDLLVTGGRFTSTGSEVMDGTGNLNDSIAANAFANLTVAGTGTIVATLTGTVCANALTIGAADSVKGPYTTRMLPTVNDWISIGAGGSLSGGGLSVNIVSNLSLAAVTIGELLTITGSAVTDTLTQTGAFASKGLSITGLTWVDGSNTATVAGGIGVGSRPTTCLKSTGTWTQSASGTILNADTANAFYSYTISDGGAGSVLVTPPPSQSGIGVACRKLTLGQNDSLHSENTVVAIVPVANDFLVMGTGSDVADSAVSGKGIFVYLPKHTLSQGAFNVGSRLTFQAVATKCSLVATGNWTAAGGRGLYVCDSIANAARGDSAFTLNFGAYGLTSGSLYIGSKDAGAGAIKLAATSGTSTLAGSVRHIVGNDTLDMNLGASYWQVGSWYFSKATYVSTGARIAFSGSATIHSPNMPALVCSTATGKPAVYGDAGTCSTLVVSSVCADTVFMDTVAINDTIKVLSQFLAHGTRGSTFIYGNLVGTNMQFPENSYAHDCKIANLKSVDRTVLRAYGCVPKGHNSGIVFGG